MSENKPYLSVVVPLLNEEDNVLKLHQKILEAVRNIGQPFEIIFVNDGSRDRTGELMAALTPLKAIHFRKRFGQTAAFDAGIKAAIGEVIITMDGDLQNDPNDIPLLLKKMDEGYDVVSGWRFNRHDPLTKRILSRGANILRKVLVKDGIHDSGCSLKAYKRECFNDIDLFGEMHRFIPAILEIDGFRVGEVKVTHHPRIHGTTKYNWKRALKGLVDMVSLWFWRKYSYRPLHLFGGGGIVLTSLGCAILAWMLVEKFILSHPIGDRLWPLAGGLLVVVGLQLFVAGLMADIIVRNYYRVRSRMNYTIREIREQ